MNAPTLIALFLAIIPAAFACKRIDAQIVRGFRVRRRLSEVGAHRITRRPFPVN